ncbi:hypothetical protein FRB99_000722 [Tulasnella sp. 403]|nr:hypothetical protein FRB99_000722 [Tulasnella sp. 403]
MASVPSRKKSLVGANGAIPFIDIPQQSNQLLNKSASASTSLYQQCSQLRAKLVRIHGFAPFLSLAAPLSSASSRQSQSTDPVRQLWDCLALGTPLCFLYDLLPGRPALDINTNPDQLDVDNVKEKKRATAKFIIAITEMKNAGGWPCDVFTISELHSEARDTNGFVKVVNTIMKLVDMLPADAFKPEESPPSPPSLPTPFDSSNSLAGGLTPTPLDAAASSSDAERERNQVIRELLETERKYVQDLEVMLAYASKLGATGVMDQDTIHHLFPGLNKLLDFQRQFLIVLEGIYEQPWHQQHWGQAFTNKEDEFAVYEPYCANYTNASELAQAEEQNLMACDMINPRSELPAFLIKPVQRICKYPLLLESLLKRAGPDYPLRDELMNGLAAAKRITDRVNEAQRREENLQTVKALEQRVEDWKGHHLSHFGRLLLDEIFFVTKSEVDREYHVFLFEKIILCCKEAIPQHIAAQNGQNRKVGKSNSILKKNMTAAERAAVAAQMAGLGGKKRMTPLLLKGRIFLNNVTAVSPSRKDGHSLQVWWKGDDDLEYFTLRCRTEEQLKQWETAISKLISQNRRPSERYGPYAPTAPPSASATQVSFTAQQLANAQMISQSQGRARYPSATPHYGGDFPITPATPSNYPPSLAYSSTTTLVHSEYQRERADSRTTDDTPTDEENWMGEDRGYESPYAASVPSGRATPNGMRRPHASMPAQKPHPLNGAARGMLNRGMSAGSDGSFGGPPPPPSGNRALRSQFSSTRLRNAYEEQPGRPSVSGPHPPVAVQQQHLRMRSASTPTQYNPNANGQTPPPIPIAPPINTNWSTGPNVLGTSTADPKRGSGSSQSTNDSSDYSISQTTSPVTPYGSNDSNLAHIRPMRSQVFANGAGDDKLGFNPPVKVKVHFREDLFVIVVQRSIDYDELMEKVGKKIRLCGGKHDDRQHFRVRYRDEDGDMISLASNDDLQIALDSNQVVLYVV